PGLGIGRGRLAARPLTDLGAVQECAVAAAEVADKRAVDADVDAAVVPGEGVGKEPIRQTQVAVAVPADDASRGDRNSVFDSDLQPADFSECYCADHDSLLNAWAQA